jgi:argininosuccinate lyase
LPLNPIAIVTNRATVGGPQPAELHRMLKLANQKLAGQDAWIRGKRDRINSSLTKLDTDFGKLLNSGK